MTAACYLYVSCMQYIHRFTLAGGLAVAVPGQVVGYKALYDRFGGGVPWDQLVEPAIQLCEGGYTVSWHLAKVLNERRDAILKEPSLR